MPQTELRFLSFDEYLCFDDGTDKLYELFNGELIEVPPESGENVGIATFLLLHFAAIVGHLRVRGHGLELEVRGEPRNRYPDLTILREEHIEQLRRRNTIRLTMAPPLLVVEVVSPGELQRDRDYVAKRAQYQDLGIPEYWIVDPQTQAITVLVWQEGLYVEAGVFCEGDRIISLAFPDLNLQTSQVFAAGQ
ncbi:MAG: Uma2 family endonuclease [Drouetiella hepatica Uher 2000/2452]|jgi:Uma2 family endonuclease|uniref:Uma2 family endonuclease n=1 Tax=Drouetiella hepatica Uher 2000/2452 TaxID=904376 RepID=A0A951UMY5_9CYAN|nr:Uma2 family endonuclease [Drouetiella hepatica Uher 2000/2452]